MSASFGQRDSATNNVRKRLDDEFSLPHSYPRLQRLAGIGREYRNLALPHDSSGIDVTIRPLNASIVTKPNIFM